MSFKSQHLPIITVLLISLLVGIFTFQDYGMAWDEFLYYQYADSIGYAYSVNAHMSEDFDINRAFEPSAWDHKNHGPAYLLLARGAVYALENLTHIDKVPLWHLLNFINFLVGAAFLYSLSLRWFKPPIALSLTLLYMTQPVLWGHAFINPKDPPFATFFIAATYFGLRMVDEITASGKFQKSYWKNIIITGILIGLATNLRVIGPLVGFMLFLYILLKKQPKALFWLIPSGLIALVTMYITWPYLWEKPIETFIGIIQTMANYPVSPKTLFYGNAYRSYEVPLRYLPILLGITLTEPTWILFGIGAIIIFLRFFKKKLEWKSLSIVIFWFVFMVAYVLLMRPHMYDNYRHFLFILPPIFIVTGFAMDQIYNWVKIPRLNTVILLGILTFGVQGNFQLHPYEYTYYNTFVGGTENAQGKYETDYWLTCYKDAIEAFDEYIGGEEETLIVYREAQNATYYAPDNIQVIGYRPFKPGDYLLLSARLNEVETVKRHSPNIIEVGRAGATFCAIREIAP